MIAIDLSIEIIYTLIYCMASFSFHRHLTRNFHIYCVAIVIATFCVSIHVCSFPSEESAHESIYAIPISKPTTLEIDEYPYFSPLRSSSPRAEPDPRSLSIWNSMDESDWRKYFWLKLTRPPPSIILNWTEIVLFPSRYCSFHSTVPSWGIIIIIHYHHHRITGKIHISLVLPHIYILYIYYVCARQSCVVRLMVGEINSIYRKKSHGQLSIYRAWQICIPFSFHVSVDVDIVIAIVGGITRVVRFAHTHAPRYPTRTDMCFFEFHGILLLLSNLLIDRTKTGARTNGCFRLCACVDVCVC